MKKLEKSLRHALAYYGPQLRNGTRYLPYGATGCFSEPFGFISSVCAKVDDGIVTDVTIYCVGDAMDAYYYKGGGIALTEEVEEFLRGNTDWNGMISEMLDKISAAADKADE